MSPIKPEEVPGKVTVEHGVILLDGPDGVALAMTSECARVTGERLVNAAAEVERSIRR